MNPGVLSQKQVRQFDQIATEQFGIDSLILMENAARGVCDVLEEFTDRDSAHSGNQRAAVIFCGRGNNGGDGMAMARHLHIRDWRTKIVLLADPADFSQDCGANWRILEKTNIPVVDGRAISEADLLAHIADFNWIVDAMLGTGSRLPLREPIRTMVEVLNRQSAKKLAVDIPTGLDCDAAQGPETVFDSDITVTFVAEKPVMRTATGKRYCGQTRIVDIGAPPETYAFLNVEPDLT